MRRWARATRARLSSAVKSVWLSAKATLQGAGGGAEPAGGDGEAELGEGLGVEALAQGGDGGVGAEAEVALDGGQHDVVVGVAEPGQCAGAALEGLDGERRREHGVVAEHHGGADGQGRRRWPAGARRVTRWCDRR